MKRLLLILLLFPFFCEAQTMVFVCGAECGENTGEAHLTTSGTASFSTSTKRTDLRSVRVNPTAANFSYAQASLTSNAVAVVRAYVYFSTLPNGNSPIVTVKEISTEDLFGAVFNSSDSKIYAGFVDVSVPSFTFGSTGVSVTTGQWYKIDVYVTNTGNTVDVKVDGTSCTQLSMSMTNDIDKIAVGHSVSSNVTCDEFFDDIVVSNTSGDYPISAGYVNHFIPTSDGTHLIGTGGSVQFGRGTTGTEILTATTDSYLLVDDEPVDDATPDANDFINCAAPAATTDYTENIFGPGSGVSTPSTGPRGVEVLVYYHQAGTGAGVSAIKLNDNGTEDDVWNVGSAAGVTTMRYTTKQYATMVGGGAWTAARFNALRIRFGYSTDANPDQYFDGAIIEAEFEELAARPYRLNIITKIKPNEKEQILRFAQNNNDGTAYGVTDGSQWATGNRATKSRYGELCPRWKAGRFSTVVHGIE